MEADMTTTRLAIGSKRPGLVRAAVLAGVAASLALTGALVSVPSAQADPAPAPAPTSDLPVPLAQAGEVRMLGPDETNIDDPSCCGVTFGGVMTPPDSLDGVAVTQVLFGIQAGLALTATGKVVGWGTDYAKLNKVPAEVAAADVIQIATGGSYAGAVTRDGRVLTWGPALTHTTTRDVPEGLTGVTQLAINGQNAVALKSDGSVVAWGASDSISTGLNDVPVQLAPGGSTKATAVAIGNGAAYALTEQGTLITWGISSLVLPAATQVPGNVKAVAGGGMVLLANNSLLKLDGKALPATVLATTPVSITGYSNLLGVLDSAGAIHGWDRSGGVSTLETPVLEDLGGGKVAQFVVAATTAGPGAEGSGAGLPGAVILTKMLRAAPPTISGTAQVGSTLTGIPGTFSASPTSVAGQWLANGTPIPDATGETLSLTSAMASQQISYRSTATKTGETTISSTSDAVTVANPVAATVKVAATKGAYGGAGTVAVTVTGATGSVSLTMDGKSLGAKALAGGKASFSVARTTAPGNHALKATYPGGEIFSAGSGTGTLSVAKGRTGVPALKVAKASHKKKGTVAVTVVAPAGLVKAAGTAQLVLKKGKSTKKVNLRVVNGKAVGALPKLAKGAWTASVTYLGSGYYAAVKSKTIKVKSK
jgi:hypothetical protein